MAPVNSCRLCNKSAKTNIVQCENCERWLHKYCCEKNQIEFDENFAKCCKDNFEDAVEVGESNSANLEGSLHREIAYLKLLIKEKNQVIKDKCSLIKDKEVIISLLQKQIEEFSKENPATNEISGVPERKAAATSPSMQKPTPSNPKMTAKCQMRGQDRTATSVQNNPPINNNADNQAVSSDKIHKNSNDWTLVSNKPGRSNKTRKQQLGIVGTNVVSQGDIKVAPKSTILFVSRLDPDTSTESLEKYVKKYFSEAECSALVSKYPKHYSSFKVCVDSGNLEKAMNPAIWPAGAYIGKFFQMKRIFPTKG